MNRWDLLNLRWFSIVVLLVGFSSPQLVAVHDLDIFELEGDAVDDPQKPGDDWQNIYDKNDNALVSRFIGSDEEADGNDRTYFTGGGSKDVNDVSQWRYSENDVAPDKDEITNAYAGAYEDAEGDVIFYFGADRFSNDGDAQIGFWFFQDKIRLENGHFIGNHREGDILILSDFTQGGKISTIRVFEWVDDGRRASLEPRGEGCDCFPRSEDCPNGNGDRLCAMVNADDGVLSPWPYQPKSGEVDRFPRGSFFEGGLNPRKMGLEVRCFSSFLAETRSSQSVTAQLKDFALGEFELCQIAVDKDGDELSKAGDAVTYDFTITNTGALPLYLESIRDVGDGWPGLGDLFDEGTDAGCGRLAAQESCQFSVDYTVKETDPDPLKNTVTVVYNSQPDLTGDQAMAEDSHEVNLFQPAVEVEKTGDEISKAGDPVNYVITVTNTSSDDSPPLVNGRITDDVLGNLLDGGNRYVTRSDCTPTLDVGESCEIRATRIVERTDPDPLVNTVTVHYNPEGFPNDISDEDMHSVDIVHPDYELTKDCEPSNAAPGVRITYTIVLRNTGDVRLKIVSSDDSLLGPIDCPPSLEVGATETVVVTRVVQPDDPNPLVNEITTVYQVDAGNLTNQLTRTASCAVELLACRMTGGGHADDGNGGNSWTFGGQAGAPTADQPQPCGEWTHHQKDGPDGDFVFHAGTASAPPGTEIDVIKCSDAGYCAPARRAPAKQIDFAGVGSFKNIRGQRPQALRRVRPGRTLHWFEVHAEDLGEPGSDGKQDPPLPTCPADGNAGSEADCECPDYYSIKIHETEDPASPVIYRASGYLDGGNLQLHPPISSGGNCSADGSTGIDGGGSEVRFLRGDANSDKKVDLTDAVYVLDHLLLGGQAPGCADAADADDNGGLDVTDAVVILESLFGGHGSIAWPFPEPGSDPTADSLEECH